MIIDSHQHVFWHGRDDAGLVADMDEQGIDLAWLLTWDVVPAEDKTHYHILLDPRNLRPDGTNAGIPLRDLIAARRAYPNRFIVGYCPHPAREGATAAFESAHQIHGVRVCGEWKFRMLFDDPRCLELFHTAGRLKCPVVLHLDVPYLPDAEGKPTFQREWYGGTIDNLERALKACPETIFIGHAPGFWREISGDADRAVEVYPSGKVTPGGRLLELFDRNPNLYADLSAGSAQLALSRDPAHAREFIIRLADRLIFGRDFYGGELHALLQSLDLPADVRRKVYSENADRLVPVVRESVPPQKAGHA